jgi:hypothetical protein
MQPGGAPTARCCYFVQTHRDPGQIHRLVATLRRGSPHSEVVVRHDFGAAPLDWGPSAGLPRTHLLRSSYPQRRGTFSGQAQPLLDTIAWLQERGIDYDWLVTLTGQDYPVSPLADFERRLEGESGEWDGYLRYWDVRSAESPWAFRKPYRRYWYRYRRLADRAMPVLRWLRPLSRAVPGVHLSLDYGPFVGVRAWRTPWSRSFRCFGGWTWFTLRRAAVDYLTDYLREHPQLLEFYRRTMSPEESLVPTVLANSDRFRLRNDDLRYIDYAGARRGVPRTLTGADLPLLAGGRFAFARKFDLSVDANVLDLIDRDLLGFAATA